MAGIAMPARVAGASRAGRAVAAGAGRVDRAARMPIRVSSYAYPLLHKAASGEVRGVFRHGLDVVRSDGRLLYLGGSDRALSCAGLQLPPAVLRLVLAAVRSGDAVELGEGALVFRGSAAPRPFRLDCTAAEAVDLRVGAPIGPSAVRALRLAVASCGLEDVVGLAWDMRLQTALTRLTGSGSTLAEAVRWLYGRGAGLTPTGDDILCGYGTGLLACGDYAAHARLVDVFRDVGRTRRTTYVSEAYLAAMAAGFSNESYVHLLEVARAGAVGGPAGSEALAAVRRLGHTSGNDTLLGFSLALGVGYRGIPARCPCT